MFGSRGWVAQDAEEALAHGEVGTDHQRGHRGRGEIQGGADAAIAPSIPEQRVEWEAEVRSLYHDGMVRIVVIPNWAKLIDFETTLPSAVEELVRQRAERQHG
jgi:hypothetical protein